MTEESNLATDATTSPKLKLVVVYDRTHNEYSISAHNQPAEEAKATIDRWGPHLIEGCSFMTLDQTRRHRNQNADDCRTCRETVARSAHIDPKPTFTRRKRYANEG